MFTTSATSSFALVMLSVIMCLGVAIQFEAWLALALIFFQLSLWGLAVALVAVAWMLLHSHAAIAVTVFMAFLVTGSLWALRPPLCLGWYMCFRHGNISDVLHWTLSPSWGGVHIITRIAMVRVLLSCGADLNAVQRHTPLPSDETDETSSGNAVCTQRTSQPECWCLLSMASKLVGAALELIHDSRVPSWCQKRRQGQASAGCVAKDKEPEAVLVTPLMRAVANPCVSSDLVHLLLDKGEMYRTMVPCLPQPCTAHGPAQLLQDGLQLPKHTYCLCGSRWQPSSGQPMVMQGHW